MKKSAGGDLDMRRARARALFFRALDDIRAAVVKIVDAGESCPDATAVAKALAGRLEDVENDAEAAASALEAERRAGSNKAGLTKRFLSDEEPPEPDALALALLVDTFDAGIGAGWQSDAASDALLWLLRRNARASSILRELAAAETEPPGGGSLAWVAQRRP